MKIVKRVGKSRGVEELLTMRTLEEVRWKAGGCSWKVCLQ